MMTVRVTDIIEVIMLATRSQTLLDTCSPFYGSLFVTQKNVLELVHAGIGKEECRVALRDQ